MKKSHTSLLLLVACLIHCSLISLATSDTPSDSIPTYTFFHPENLPKFKHENYSTFEAYVQANISYPQKAFDTKTKGTVELNFIIDIDGQCKNIEVAKSVSPSIDYEAIKAIKDAAGWQPAVHPDGLPVPYNQFISVTFSLDSNTVINQENTINSYQKLELALSNQSPSSNLCPLNSFINTFRNVGNQPGWYNCNNSFSFMHKKVARVKTDDAHESVYVVFTTNNTTLKNGIGTFDEKEEIKQLLKNPENDELVMVGVKLINAQSYFAFSKFEPKGDIIYLDYKSINPKKLTAKLKQLGLQP